MTDRVLVGRVGRPHGLAGAFVVERPSEDPARFAVGARLLADGEPVEVVESRRVGGGRLAIRLDRPVARGTPLEIDKADLPPTEADEYYVFDLVGLDVVDADGATLGRVATVLPYPANDVLELDNGLALPMVADCILNVDLTARRIVVATGYAGGG